MSEFRPLAAVLCQRYTVNCPLSLSFPLASVHCYLTSYLCLPLHTYPLFAEVETGFLFAHFSATSTRCHNFYLVTDRISLHLILTDSLSCPVHLPRILPTSCASRAYSTSAPRLTIRRATASSNGGIRHSPMAACARRACLTMTMQGASGSVRWFKWKNRVIVFSDRGHS